MNTIKNKFKVLIILSLIVIFILLIYFYPKNSNYIEETLIYEDVLEMPIFLMDKNNYIAKTTIIKNNDNIIDIVKELIESLTVDGKKAKYITHNFKALIPKDTKLLDVSLDNNILKLNFNKNFYNIKKELSEKMLESIIYSLTEIDGIDKIMIFVEKEQLKIIPNTNKKIPNLLDRTFGINKIYNLDSIKDTSMITIYYLSKDNDFYYYVPVTLINNDNKEKIEIIIDSLKSTPVYHTNLISYLATSANLLNYEILENSISLSFNNKILANLDDKSILEEVKYSIALSIKDTYNIEKVIFNVDNEEITTVMK